MNRDNDYNWIKFAIKAAQMMDAVRGDKRQPLAPLVQLIESTNAIKDDELRTDLINILYEMGGNPGDFDTTVRLLETSRSEKHYIDLKKRLDDYRAERPTKLNYLRRKLFKLRR